MVKPEKLNSNNLEAKEGKIHSTKVVEVLSEIRRESICKLHGKLKMRRKFLKNHIFSSSGYITTYLFGAPNAS